MKNKKRYFMEWAVAWRDDEAVYEKSPLFFSAREAITWLELNKPSTIGDYQLRRQLISQSEFLEDIFLP